jgi:hypothetical protein
VGEGATDAVGVGAPQASVVRAVATRVAARRMEVIVVRAIVRV